MKVKAQLELRQSQRQQTEATATNDGKVMQLPTSCVRRCPDQPRQYFDPDEMRELEISIVAVGQRQPINVTPVPENSNGHRYEIIDGERRWTICRKLGIPVKAIGEEVKDKTDQFIKSCVSNFARSGHTPLEIAYAIKRIMAETGKSAVEVGHLFGRSHACIYQHLSLLKLQPEVLELMNPSRPKNQRLGMSVAVHLVNLPPDLQVTTAQNIITRRLKLGQARQHINLVASRAGVSVYRREPQPRDILRGLRRFMEHADVHFKPFSGMDTDAIAHLFEFRPDPIAEIDRTTETLTAHIQQAQKLLQHLQRARQRYQSVKKRR